MEVTQRKTSSAGVHLLSLPREIRIMIYRLVLDAPQTLCLMMDATCSRVQTFAPSHPQRRWLALLHVNKQVHDEAAAELYGWNRFHVVNTIQGQHHFLSSFFGTIGSINAGLLSRLCISLPVPETVASAGTGDDGIRQPGQTQLQLRNDDFLTVKLLREKFTALMTLEALVHVGNRYALTGDLDAERPHFTRDALLLIDEQLKSIPTLKRVIVNIASIKATPLAIDLMHRFGWVVLRSARY